MGVTITQQSTPAMWSILMKANSKQCTKKIILVKASMTGLAPISSAGLVSLHVTKRVSKTLTGPKT